MINTKPKQRFSIAALDLKPPSIRHWLVIRHLFLVTIFSVSIFFLAACEETKIKREAVDAKESCTVFDKDIGNYYKGDCKDGLADGKGLAKGRDTYQGDFKAGGPHGYGVYTWGSGSGFEGDRYEGQWTNDQRTGVGKYTSASGQIDDGEFINGKFQRGKIIHADGQIHEGGLVDGKFDGIVRSLVPEAWLIGRSLPQPEDWVLANGYYEQTGLYRDGKFIISCTTLDECAQKLESDNAETTEVITREQFRTEWRKAIEDDESFEPLSKSIDCVADFFEEQLFREGQDSVALKKAHSLMNDYTFLKSAAEACWPSQEPVSKAEQDKRIIEQKSSYVTKDFNSLKVDIDDLLGKKIKVSGIAVYMMDQMMLKKDAMSANFILTDISNISRDEKLSIFENCNNPMMGCKVTVEGTVGEVLYEEKGILAESVVVH